MQLRIMVSRHSAFYSPLISTVADLDAAYSVLGAGQRSHDLIREGTVHIMQSAVSSNWKLMEQGVKPLPVHFAQINRRDGFFIAGHEPDAAFSFDKLAGKTLLADHGLQPLAMLKYAAHVNGVDWASINVVNGGEPGEGDYLHRQAPGWGSPLMSVGASMPEVAFSSLCASPEFMATAEYRAFVSAYRTAREWVRVADPMDVAAKQAPYFPGVESSELAESIRQYQRLDCWAGAIEIPRDLYEQALNVFEYAGEIKSRPPYDDVCRAP